MLAVNQAMLGRHGKAKELYEGVLSSHAGHPLVALSAPPGLAVISVIEGDLDGARKRIDDWSQNNPMANIAALRNQFSDTLKDQAFAERYLDALRHAGLPENPPLPLPDKPSIAVLPFTNMSDDPEQEWFADGMTDDLITDLSNISGLFVIARNTAFTYKDKAVDVKAVGRDWVLGTSSKAACGAPATRSASTRSSLTLRPAAMFGPRSMIVSSRTFSRFKQKLHDRWLKFWPSR